MDKKLFYHLANFPHFPALVSTVYNSEPTIKRFADAPTIIIGKIKN